MKWNQIWRLDSIFNSSGSPLKGVGWSTIPLNKLRLTQCSCFQDTLPGIKPTHTPTLWRKTSKKTLWPRSVLVFWVEEYVAIVWTVWLHWYWRKTKVQLARLFGIPSLSRVATSNGRMEGNIALDRTGVVPLLEHAMLKAFCFFCIPPYFPATRPKVHELNAQE